jgi:hypothetical protein
MNKVMITMREGSGADLLRSPEHARRPRCAVITPGHMCHDQFSRYIRRLSVT